MAVCRIVSSSVLPYCARYCTHALPDGTPGRVHDALPCDRPSDAKSFHLAVARMFSLPSDARRQLISVALGVWPNVAQTCWLQFAGNKPGLLRQRAATSAIFRR